MPEKAPPTKGPDLKQITRTFLDERTQARAALLAEELGDARPPAVSEDALAEDILRRIYGGGTATVEERRFLRRKLEALRSPGGGERIPAPLAAMSDMKRLELAAVLDVLRHAAGE
jgi:hypothetical protein